MDRTNKNSIKDLAGQSRDDYKEIFNQSSIGIIFYDKEGTTINANNSALKIMAISQLDDILGINLFDNPFIEEKKEKLFNEGIIRFQASLDLENIKVFDFYTPTKKGVIFLDYTVSVTDSGFLVQIQDVSESKNAEELIMESQELLRTVIEGIPDPIFVKDRQSRILLANPATLQVVGKSLEEVVGKDDRDLYEDPDVGEAIMANDRRIMESGQTEVIEEIGQTPEGHRTFLSTKTPYRNSNGEIIGIMGVTRDITELKKTEDKLFKSQGELARAQKIAQIGSWTWDIPTDEISWSDESYRIYGLDPGEVDPTYELFLSFIIPEDRERVNQEVQKAIGNGHKYNVTYNIIRKDGVPRIILSENDIITDESGRVIRMYGTNQDITDRKKEEKITQDLLEKEQQLTEELTASNEELQSTTEELQAANEELRHQGDELLLANHALRQSQEDMNRAQEVGQIGSWRLDVRRNILTWSDENYRIFGVPKGTPLTYETFLGIVHLDDRQYVDTQWKAGLAGEPYDIEHRIVVGDRVKWVREKAYLEFDDESMVLGGFGITQDITERKKLEEDLRKSHDNLDLKVEERTAALKLASIYNRSLIEASLDPLVTIGSDGKINDVNSSTESVTGYHRDELIGTDFSNYFTEPEKARSGYKQVFRKGLVRDYPLEIKHKEGYITPVLYNATVYKDESGEIIGVFAAAHDITERKQAEEQLKETISELERSNQELQSFAYITSHDLQEPLRTMGSYAGLLKHRYGGQLDSDADDFIDFMISGAARLQEMIKGLLDYSRVGTQGEVFKDFSAEGALDTALTNLKSPIEKCHVEVLYDSLPVIHADESQISRVFQNLIGNALKFRKKDVQPKIHIKAQKEGHEYVFGVQDNGIGLEEQYCDRIFEVFKRLHAIGEYEGTGIGLSIVKRIIERHHGRIWVESSLGVGSTFYFTIPINK